MVAYPRVAGFGRAGADVVARLVLVVPVQGFDAESMGQPAELTTVVHGERALYDSSWVRLVKVDVTPPDGHRFEHHVVRLQRVALAAVVDDEDRVLMLWRHRFPVQEWGWELPGGIVAAEEDSLDCARREALEETGWAPIGGVRLAAFQPMPGMVDTPHEVFFFNGADHVAEPSDAEEAAIVEWVPLAEIPALIDQGLILGAGSLVGLLRVLTRR
ncbi:NUDIX hydrolase [Humibacter antri]